MIIQSNQHKTVQEHLISLKLHLDLSLASDLLHCKISREQGVKISEFVSGEPRLRGFNHVQEEISHTRLPFEQRERAIAAVHRPLRNQLVGSVQQKASKSFSPVLVLLVAR